MGLEIRIALNSIFISILLGVGAMALPLAYPDAPKWIWHAVVWTAGTGFVASCLLLIHDVSVERFFPRGERIAPMLLMIVGETCFLMGAIWYGVDAMQPKRDTRAPIAAIAAPTAEQIADAMLGRNNFCYFSLYTTEPKNMNGPYQLAITGVGGPVRELNYWIAPASSKATTDPTDPYYSIDFRKPAPLLVYEGTRASDRALPAGEYRIEFDSGSSGNWNQWLTIEKTADGKLRHRIRVVSDKRGLLYDSEAK